MGLVLDKLMANLLQRRRVWDRLELQSTRIRDAKEKMVRTPLPTKTSLRSLPSDNSK
jgi:hypothetical protein